MLAFLGLPKGYITAPRSQGAGAGPAVGDISKEEC